MLIKQLAHDDAKRATIWAVLVVRLNGTDMELLSITFPTRELAEREAEGVRKQCPGIAVKIVPAVVDFTRMISLGEASAVAAPPPADLFALGVTA